MVLVYSHRPDAEDHGRYRNWLDEVLNSESTGILRAKPALRMTVFCFFPQMVKTFLKPEFYGRRPSFGIRSRMHHYGWRPIGTAAQHQVPTK
jgi:hypothetical protein